MAGCLVDRRLVVSSIAHGLDELGEAGTWFVVERTLVVDAQEPLFEAEDGIRVGTGFAGGGDVSLPSDGHAEHVGAGSWGAEDVAGGSAHCFADLESAFVAVDADPGGLVPSSCRWWFDVEVQVVDGQDVAGAFGQCTDSIIAVPFPAQQVSRLTVQRFAQCF